MSSGTAIDALATAMMERIGITARHRPRPRIHVERNRWARHQDPLGIPAAPGAFGRAPGPKMASLASHQCKDRRIYGEQ
jgi:hypothetical protein